MIPSNQLADNIPIEAELSTVDILIGSEFFWSIVGGNKMTLPPCMFMLSFKFGYIVTSKCSNSNNYCSVHNSSGYHTLFVSADVKQDLYCLTDTHGMGKPSLENLWSLEAIGIKDPLSPDYDDDEVLHKFCESIKFNKGRYYIAWPLKQVNVCLPDNYTLAVKCMKSLVNCFQLDPELIQKYIVILRQQLEKGMIERVDNSTLTNTRKYYLPHHSVLTPSKATTKVRIVYDGSAKIQSASSSLNDCLHRGPIIIPGVLM